MPAHEEQRVLPYSAEQLFDIVAAVDCYPEFIPWCQETRITRREEDTLHADMVIGFRSIRQEFSSRVVLERPHRIVIAPTAGPFRRMESDWQFMDLAAGGCEVAFRIDFEFRSRLLRALIGALFHEAAQRMVGAFEDRARMLYGPPVVEQAPLARA